MSKTGQMIPPTRALSLASLVAATEQGTSRVLAKTTGGNVTLVAFDVG
jgi:hypothetical protein